MADVMTPEQRSRCMAAVKGKDTKPEMIVRKYLFSRGLRYRVNNRKLPGSPDIVLKKYKTVVFIDGCFWHGHEGCKYYRLPKTNVNFWRHKIAMNIARDYANGVDPSCRMESDSCMGMRHQDKDKTGGNSRKPLSRDSRD